METISQDGTNVEYEIWINVFLDLIDGHTMHLSLTREEYEDFNNAIENGNIRWRLLKKSKDGKSYWKNEWVFLNNVYRITYSEVLLDNGCIVQTRAVST